MFGQLTFHFTLGASNWDMKGEHNKVDSTFLQSKMLPASFASSPRTDLVVGKVRWSAGALEIAQSNSRVFSQYQTTSVAYRAIPDGAHEAMR